MREGTKNSSLQAMPNTEKRFLALADYLRLPLLNIAVGAELTDIDKQSNSHEALARIGVTASTTLNLIDAYLLAEQAKTGQINLDLEPVSVSAVLHDVAHQLTPIAKLHQCKINVSYHSGQQPVMAYRPALQAALLSLGQVFIDAVTQKQKSVLINLTSYKLKDGVATGVFAKDVKLSRSYFKKALYLGGRARMPLPELVGSSGAGVYIADSLFDALSSKLRIARHSNLNGLAATLITSRQLSLV